MPDFDFTLDDDEEFIRVQNQYQNLLLVRRSASSGSPATANGTPSLHHPRQPLSSAASSRPVQTFASTLPAPLHPSTPSSIPSTGSLAHPEPVHNHPQHSTNPSTHSSSSAFPSGSTSLPRSQPTYDAIVERYQSPFHPHVTQPATQSYASSATAHRPLPLGTTAAPRFQDRDTAPPLNTAIVLNGSGRPLLARGRP